MTLLILHFHIRARVSLVRIGSQISWMFFLRLLFNILSYSHIFIWNYSSQGDGYIVKMALIPSTLTRDNKELVHVPSIYLSSFILYYRMLWQEIGKQKVSNMWKRRGAWKKILQSSTTVQHLWKNKSKDHNLETNFVRDHKTGSKPWIQWWVFRANFKSSSNFFWSRYHRQQIPKH